MEQNDFNNIIQNSKLCERNFFLKEQAIRTLFQALLWADPRAPNNRSARSGL